MGQCCLRRNRMYMIFGDGHAVGIRVGANGEPDIRDLLDVALQTKAMAEMGSISQNDRDQLRGLYAYILDVAKAKQQIQEAEDRAKASDA